MSHVAEVPSTPEDKDATLSTTPVKENDTDVPATENEKNLRTKLIELGDETAKKLKEILSEVDKDELKKSLDKDKALNFLAGALDNLNEKVQGLLAPKGETRSKEHDGSEEASSDTESSSDEAIELASSEAPRPEGAEVFVPKFKEDPFLEEPDEKTQHS